MIPSSRPDFRDSLRTIPATRLAWLWLVAGFALLPFTFWQTVIPLAAWLAPVFLLRFERTCARRRLVLPLIFAAYAFGIFITTGRAIGGAPLAESVIFIIQFPLVKGLMYMLPFWADGSIGRRLGAWGRTLVFPLAFTTVDWVMSRLIPIMNTGSPAYTQYGDLPLMQIISVTGMWSLTFQIMWFAATVNGLWEAHFDWRRVRGQLGLFAGVLLAVFAYGVVRLTLAAPAGDTLNAATITIDAAISKEASSSINWATFNQSTDAQREAARPGFQATVSQMLARTETALRGGAKLVAWQEASAFVLEEDKPGVLDRVSALAKQYDAYIQVGLWVPTRTSARAYVHNQVVLIDNTGRVVWTYDKSHPVIPDEWWVMIPGSGRLPVADTAYGRMSAAICNDLHFPPLIQQAGQNNVDIFLAPYGSIVGFEHEDFVVAVYRTIENGFSLVRPTSNGLSAVVDYEGRILGSQDYFTTTTGIMQAGVPLQGVTTIYSRIGDLFAYLCAAGLIVLAGWTLVRREQPVLAAASKSLVL
jgi:apolipoprotein N-acyltransferase